MCLFFGQDYRQIGNDYPSSDIPMHMNIYEYVGHALHVEC